MKIKENMILSLKQRWGSLNMRIRILFCCLLVLGLIGIFIGVSVSQRKGHQANIVDLCKCVTPREKAVLAADGIYASLLAFYGPEDGIRRPEDLLAKMGKGLIKYMLNWKQENSYDSVITLGYYFNNEWNDPRLCVNIATCVVYGWHSQIYTRSDFFAYEKEMLKMYFDRLALRLLNVPLPKE